MRNFFEKIKDKIDAWLDKIPLKIQVLINVSLLCILAVFLYTFLHGPTISMEHQYRRAAQQSLVGPGEILGIESLSTAWFDKLVVAQTQEGVILYAGEHTNQETINFLVYRPFDEDIMVCGSPALLSSIAPPKGDPLTIILFDRYPEAVRAELDIELFWENNQTGRQYRYQYALSGERSNAGYFRLDMDYAWKGYIGIEEHPEDAAINQFTAHSRDASYRAPEGEYPATVRLYDAEGKQVCCKEFYVFPQEGQVDR